MYERQKSSNACHHKYGEPRRGLLKGTNVQDGRCKITGGNLQKPYLVPETTGLRDWEDRYSTIFNSVRIYCRHVTGFRPSGQQADPDSSLAPTVVDIIVGRAICRRSGSSPTIRWVHISTSAPRPEACSSIGFNGGWTPSTPPFRKDFCQYASDSPEGQILNPPATCHLLLDW